MGLKQPTRMNYVQGACMFVKSFVIKKVEIMEPKFFLDYEELESCHRIVKKCGCEIGMN